MSNLILLASVLIPTLFVIGGLVVWRGLRKLDRRRSPLTTALLNLPGEGLRKRVAKHDEAFMEATAMIVMVGPIILATWLLARMVKAGVDWSKLRFDAGDALIFSVGLCLVAWGFWRMTHHARQRRLAKQGLEAELAVAQNLTSLIAEGAMVFHDFPADRFNIDHIVIGQGAVFAVETKSRKKPAERGRQSARVRYDAQQLFFPRHTETKPLEQAQYQATWLEKFLHRAVGEPVRVIPLLALPGWYVERTNRDVRATVLVSNCTNSGFMMSDKFGAAMTDPLRKRIAHVLTERYPPLPTD